MAGSVRLVVVFLLAMQYGGCAEIESKLPDDSVTFDLRMKGAKPEKADEYLCSGYQVPKGDNYIVQFEALADAGTAHHILVFGCQEPAFTSDTWKCGRTCSRGSGQILFAWAKNAPPLKLPKDVGRHIGSSVNIDHIVIQVHYARKFTADEDPDHSGIRLYLTKQRQKYVAGIYLLLAYTLEIPPNTEKYSANISCTFNGLTSIFPFGFRTHAHELGRVVSGYKINGETYDYTQIGKGNPQWPQAFYPVKDIVEVKPGDKLAAQCTYSSIGRNRVTHIGARSSDEMCNFYIMYFMDADQENSIGDDTCAGVQNPWIIEHLPEGSDVALPPNKTLEGAATGHHHHHVMTGDDKDETQNESKHEGVDEEKNNDQQEIASVVSKDIIMNFVSAITEPKNVKFGQVGGVAASSSGDLYVFHRGDNVWDARSFDMKDNFQQKQYPVMVDPVVVIDNNGTVRHSFGRHDFYLPHGISVDPAGNIWVTDVALHQVMRVPPGQSKPDLVLGEKFVPGSDDKHFCKPADAIAMSTGEFFVADGYCNSRIMKFDKNGKLLKSWGTFNGPAQEDGYPESGKFYVPHSLALAEDKGLLCVADRENGRIQCFDLEGNFVRQMHPKLFGRKLYAVEYCPNHGGLLFAVNGKGYGRNDAVIQGFTLNINDGMLLSTWNIPSGMQSPHDVTVDVKNNLVYVGELLPTKVWKFEMPHSTASQVKVNTEISDDKYLITGTKSSMKETAEEDFTPSLIIGMLLVVPVVLLIVITVLVRLYHTGHLGNCKRRRGKKAKFNLGSLLNSHKGFDRLSTEESDHELDDAMDDSDQEEFSITRNSKA